MSWGGQNMQVQEESEKNVEDKSSGLLKATPEIPSPALLGVKITAISVFLCFVSLTGDYKKRQDTS